MSYSNARPKLLDLKKALNQESTNKIFIKQIRCKNCKKLFTPIRPLQKVCSYTCAQKLSNKYAVKEWRDKRKIVRESLKTKSSYLRDLQIIFNNYIRERDKFKPCISCNKPLVGKYDAGHYFGIGGYPELRFNENNCHGQCVHCNQHNHGNLIEYRKGLINRIGLDELNNLENISGKEIHFSISEIKEKIIYYKNLLKALK